MGTDAPPAVPSPEGAREAQSRPTSIQSQATADLGPLPKSDRERANDELVQKGLAPSLLIVDGASDQGLTREDLAKLATGIDRWKAIAARSALELFDEINEPGGDNKIDSKELRKWTQSAALKVVDKGNGNFETVGADGTRMSYERGPGSKPLLKETVAPDGKKTTFEYAPDGGLTAINHPVLGRIEQGNNATNIMLADEPGRFVIKRESDYVTIEPNGNIQSYDKIPSEQTTKLTGVYGADGVQRTFKYAQDGSLESAAIGNRTFTNKDGKLTFDDRGNLTVESGRTTSEYRAEPPGAMVITSRGANGKVRERIHKDPDSKGGKWWRSYSNEKSEWVTEQVDNVNQIKDGYIYRDPKTNSQVTQWDGGERDVLGADGKWTKFDREGKPWYVERTSRNGGDEVFQRNGDKWTRTAGGKVQELDGFELLGDGRVKIKVRGFEITENPDGTTDALRRNPDGSATQRTYNPDGAVSRFQSWTKHGYEDVQHDGKSWNVVQPDGKKVPVRVEALPEGGYEYITADGLVVTQRGDGRREVNAEAFERNKKYEELATEYGLSHETVSENGKTVHKYFATGRNHERIEVLSSDKPLEEARIDLEKARDEKLAELEKTYNVKIARAGDKAADGGDTQLRTPGFTEIYAMEKALEQSDPSFVHRPETDKPPAPLVIQFKKEIGYGAGGSFSTSDRTGEVVPWIMMLGTNNVDQAFVANEIQRVLMHELAHNGQQNAATDAGNADYVDRLYGEKLGFTRVKGKDANGDNDDMWILNGTDGRNYAYMVVGKDVKGKEDRKAWVEVTQNSDGRWERKEGGPELEREDVAKVAKVTPITEYFVNPYEMSADTMVAFRIDSSSRTALYMKNPALYQIAKELDQQEINRAYGANRFIRNQNGKLVPATEENLAKLKEYEDGLRVAGST